MTTQETTHSTPALHYQVSEVEHTIVAQRRTGEVLNVAVQHFDDVHQLHLAVFTGDPDFPTCLQEIEITFEECRLLRTMLNRLEITEILSH